MARCRVRLVAVVVLVAVLVVALAQADVTTVVAHAEYTRSTPAAGARVPRAPARVEVWFTQELFRRGGANVLEVLAADGSRVDDGESVVDASDRTHLSVALSRVLEAGTYRVNWRSLSAVDGDTAEGSYEFTVDPAAPEAELVAPAPDTDLVAPTSSLVRGGEAPWRLALAIPGLLGSAWLVALAVRAPFEDERA